MSAKKQSNGAEAVRNAATGYAVVVLAIACFMLAAALLMAGVRVIVGLGPSSSPTTGTPVTTTATGATAPVDTSAVQDADGEDEGGEDEAETEEEPA